MKRNNRNGRCDNSVCKPVHQAVKEEKLSIELAVSGKAVVMGNQVASDCITPTSVRASEVAERRLPSFVALAWQITTTQNEKDVKSLTENMQNTKEDLSIVQNINGAHAEQANKLKMKQTKNCQDQCVEFPLTTGLYRVLDSSLE